MVPWRNTIIMSGNYCDSAAGHFSKTGSHLMLECMAHQADG